MIDGVDKGLLEREAEAEGALGLGSPGEEEL